MVSSGTRRGGSQRTSGSRPPQLPLLGRSSLPIYIDTNKQLWILKTDKIDFDIIIDDGKHEYTSNINFLEN